MLCQSDLILLHKWGLDDSQSHTTVGTTAAAKMRCSRARLWPCLADAVSAALLERKLLTTRRDMFMYIYTTQRHEFWQTV